MYQRMQDAIRIAGCPADAHQINVGGPLLENNSEGREGKTINCSARNSLGVFGIDKVRTKAIPSCEAY